MSSYPSFYNVDLISPEGMEGQEEEEHKQNVGRQGSSSPLSPFLVV